MSLFDKENRQGAEMHRGEISDPRVGVIIDQIRDVLIEKEKDGEDPTLFMTMEFGLTPPDIQEQLGTNNPTVGFGVKGNASAAIQVMMMKQYLAAMPDVKQMWDMFEAAGIKINVENQKNFEYDDGDSIEAFIKKM